MDAGANHLDTPVRAGVDDARGNLVGYGDPAMGVTRRKNARRDSRSASLGQRSARTRLFPTRWNRNPFASVPVIATRKSPLGGATSPT